MAVLVLVQIAFIMFAFSTASFSVGFFVVVAVVVFSYSLTFSLRSFRVMNPDLSLGCRALRDSSWELSEMGGKVA